MHAIRAGNTLYVAGQVARDEQGAVVGQDAATQARQVYANIGRVLEAAGARWTDVVKVTTYLVDRADSRAVSAVRFEHFGDHRPPHTGLIVAGLGSLDNIWDATAGMPGLEEFVPLISRSCKANLAVGADADVVIVDTRTERVHDHRTLYTKSRETALIYDGMRMHGFPVATVVRGKVVMRDGKVVGDPGWGQWVKPA